MNEVNTQAVADLMRNTREDLKPQSGRFSPGDWEKILDEARGRLLKKLEASPPAEAWSEVVREFHREKYWQFPTNYKKPKREKNLGLTLVWLTFQSMTLTKVAILWFGQDYSNTDSELSKWLFFGVLFFIPANAFFFIWRWRKTKSD